MIVDHDHRYIFIAVPKTASISISFSLEHGDNIPEPALYHQGLTEILATYPDCTDYYKFAFVRNPWARLASLYHDFTKKRGHQYSALVRHEQPLFHEFKDFEDLCLRVQDTPWWQDIFFKSQFDLLALNGRLGMDFVGRYERLQLDFDHVCQKLGVATKLLHMNEGKYDSSSYHQYYTDAARDAVAKLYARDIQEFGYEW